MYVHQKLNILFYPINSKKSADGLAPLYGRVTIDGIEDQISTGLKIDPNCWDPATKKVTENFPDHKVVNMRMGRSKLTWNGYLTW